MKLKLLSLTFMLLSASQPHSLCAGITFSFTQEARFFQIPNPDPDFLIGDTLTGTYTFDPLTPSEPASGGYVHFASAITSWSVTFPRLGLTFNGTAGDIDLGNDTPFYLSDRYLATLFTQGTQNPLFPSGRTLRFVQLDLSDIEDVFNPRPADLLVNSLLPTAPPDLNRITIATQGSATGHIRFNENNNQLQTRLNTLNAIPEPGSFCFGAFLLLPCLRRTVLRRRAHRHVRR